MMTRSWMEVISPGSSWLLDQRKSVDLWSDEENKRFENALAYVDENLPNRWEKVADMIPGKSADEVLNHYRDLVEDVNHIEAGLIPFPGYTSSFMLDWESGQGYEGLKQAYCAVAGGKRAGGRSAEHERKKGVPWTEDEHRQFLMGLKKYGKGDWRNISRNYVVTRTPTQVASHAQKYFIRLNSGSKDKRRSSIHDITTVNLPTTRPSSPSQQPSGLSTQTTSAVAPGSSDQFSGSIDSYKHNEAASVFNPFMPTPYGLESYRMKSQAPHLHRGGLHNSPIGLYPMQ